MLALAVPVFLVASLPMGGWALGAGVWTVQKGMQAYFESRVRRSADPRTVVGLMAGGAIARAWFAAVAILAVGLLTSNRVGLSAVVLILVLFTVYFAGRVAERAAERAREAE